jgi:hypothetical protein
VAITKAIGSMVRAHGASAVARKAVQRRDGLYKMFSGRSNPPLDKTLAILLALDIQLNAKPVRRLVELGLTATPKASPTERLKAARVSVSQRG